MPAMQIDTLAEHASFGGVQGFYRHASSVIGLPMKFGVYRPPQAGVSSVPAADGQPLPLLIFLAGLTCNEETFAIKAGAQRLAAEHGLLLLTPDTSPRATGIEGATADWDFGEGAGFYLDATQAPWSRHWRMESYLTQELLPLVLRHFNGRADRVGLFGHSMGGHGALTLALRHPALFRSVSALAPICAPSQVPWGHKALGAYLGNDRSSWAPHDAVALIESGARCAPLLVDQGLADKFLVDQLRPEALEAACTAAGQPLTLRRHAGYDHGYFFIASMMVDHIAHHAAQLVTNA